MLDGIRYLRLKPLLLMTFVVDIIAMVCGMPRALFPQMAQETFGGPVGGGLALGMLNAGLAIGSLIGGLTGGWIHRIYRQGIAIVVAILLWGLSMTLFGTTSVLWLAVLYLAIGGWADLVSAVYRSTILQVTATDEMRGRIQGVFTVVVAGGPRLADLVHGVVADATSTQFAVVAGGLATIVLTLRRRRCWAAASGGTTPAAPPPTPSHPLFARIKSICATNVAPLGTAGTVVNDFGRAARAAGARGDRRPGERPPTVHYVQTSGSADCP